MNPHMGAFNFSCQGLLAITCLYAGMGVYLGD